MLEQLAYSIGQMGILFEPLAKMNQYVGFYVPKAVDAWARLLFKVDWIHNSKAKSFIIVMLMCGFIGIAHSRGHYERRKKDALKEISESDDYRLQFDSFLYPLWH